MTPRSFVFTVAIAASLAAPLGNIFAAPQETSTACADPAFRQFDFWRGTWSVTQNGKRVGTNHIEPVLNGCALLESWSGEGGVKGHSLNIYDATRGVWHQTWVDSEGSLLIIEGNWRNGSMVLEGTAAAAKGVPPARHRITWTPGAKGTVRQHWEKSVDDGKTWSTEFDGLYERTGDSPRVPGDAARNCGVAALAFKGERPG